MDKKLFNKNLKWLKKNNFVLYEKIKATVPRNTVLVENQCGYNLVKIISGKAFPLYSSFDIKRQCRAWLDYFQQSSANKNFVIIYGMGLGYELKELLRSDLPYSVLLIEPDQENFFYNLHFFDLSSLEKHNIYLIQDDRAEEIISFLQDVIQREETVKFFFYPLPGYYYIYKEHIQQLQEKIKEKVNTILVSLSTVIAFDKQWLQNYILNLKQLPGSVPVERFRGSFEGIPAIMVGAGPSLEYDLDVLKELYDKALIVPVGSAFSVLDNHGIKGHVAGAIDGAFDEAKIFAKNCNNQEIALFYSFMVNYKVPLLFNKERFFFAMHHFDQYIYRRLGQQCVTIASGGSVSISILDILAKMGCNPIILIGQDLCYSNNQTYAKGAIYFEKTDEEILRKKGYIRTENKKGDTVYTTRPMLAMRATTEELIKQYRKIRFINCTRNGLSIKGAMDDTLENIRKHELKATYNIPGIINEVYQNNVYRIDRDQVNTIIDYIEGQTRLIMDRCGRIITILDENTDNHYSEQAFSTTREAEEQLEQLEFYTQVLKKETGVYSFLFNNLSSDRSPDLNLEAKKRYYSKIYELCLIILNAIEYGDEEIQEVSKALSKGRA